METIEGDPYHRWMLDRRDSQIPPEFREYVAPKKLPFGWNPALKSDSLTASVGQACVANMEDIAKFMNYKIGKVCPNDDNLARRSSCCKVANLFPVGGEFKFQISLHLVALIINNGTTCVLSS